MKLIDGLFKYGETVVIDVDGKRIKRKVHFANGELFVEIGGKRIKENEVPGKRKWDEKAYRLEYMRKNRDQISVVAQKGTKIKWKTYASNLNMSMNAFIIYCVEKEINAKEQPVI